MTWSRREILRSVSAVALFASIATAANATEPDYGLKPGKPYAGTKLTYLAPVASQYSGHEARAAEFTKLTGIEVEFEFIPFKTLLEKILAIKIGGDSDPDLINYMDAWGPGLRDLFVPLDEQMAQDGVSMDRYFLAHQQGATYDGKVYGLPLRGHAQLLFYRKDLLEKHGLKVPEAWDELVAAAKLIKEKEGLGLANYYSPKNQQNIFTWVNLLWSNGGELIQDGKLVFNSPAGVEALKFYADLELEHEINTEGALSFTPYDASLSVAAGKSAFFMGWWWHYGSRILGKNTTLDPGQIGFTGVPAFGGENAVTFAMSMPTGINVNSANREAAWEFLKWVSNPDLEKRNVTEKQDRNVIVALHKQNLGDEEVNAANRGLHSAAAKSLGNSRVWPQVDVWPEIMQLIANAISDVASNGADPQEALDHAAEQGQKLLDRG